MDLENMDFTNMQFVAGLCGYNNNTVVKNGVEVKITNRDYIDEVMKDKRIIKSDSLIEDLINRG